MRQAIDTAFATVGDVKIGSVGANADTGTATITAIYKWAIPYGNGTVRNDYVLATINVKVT